MSAPLFVVRGGPTPEELAAVVAVLSARPAAAPPTAPQARSLWAVPRLRAPLIAGPDAWQGSALPR